VRQLSVLDRLVDACADRLAAAVIVVFGVRQTTVASLQELGVIRRRRLGLAMVDFVTDQRRFVRLASERRKR